MNDADQKPMVGFDPQYFPPGEVVERSPAERPKDDTIDAIIDWLGGPAGQIPSLIEEFDEFAWRMLAAGIPLLRTAFHLRTPCKRSLPMRRGIYTATKITRSAG